MKNLSKQLRLSQKESAQIIGGFLSKTSSGKDNTNTVENCHCHYIDVATLTNDNQATICVCLCVSTFDFLKLNVENK
jgi:hypothetical protein